MNTDQLEILIEKWREKAKLAPLKGIIETYNFCADDLERLIKETK